MSKVNLREHSLMGSSPRHSPHSSESASYLRQVQPGPSLRTNSQKRVKTKRSVRLSELMAAMYPGAKVGHQLCVPQPMFVPQTMGWLWNTEDTADGVPFPRGYRPGAVALGVKKRFIHRRSRSIIEPLNTPVGVKSKKGKSKRMKNTSSTIMRTATQSLSSIHERDIPPTLHVRKEKGVYRVTMQPIGAPQLEGEEENPVQFKIADSASTRSGTSGSSSTLKIEYMCTGARRKPVIKPELAEISTQWDITDITKPELDKKKETKEETTEAPTGKVKKNKPLKKGKIKSENTDGGKEVTQINTPEKTKDGMNVQESNIQKGKEKK